MTFGFHVIHRLKIQVQYMSMMIVEKKLQIDQTSWLALNTDVVERP